MPTQEKSLNLNSSESIFVSNLIAGEFKGEKLKNEIEKFLDKNGGKELSELKDELCYKNGNEYTSRKIEVYKTIYDVIANQLNDSDLSDIFIPKVGQCNFDQDDFSVLQYITERILDNPRFNEWICLNQSYLLSISRNNPDLERKMVLFYIEKEKKDVNRQNFVRNAFLLYLH